MNDVLGWLLNKKKDKIDFIPIILHLGVDIGMGWSQMDLCLNPRLCHFLVCDSGPFSQPPETSISSSVKGIVMIIKVLTLTGLFFWEFNVKCSALECSRRSVSRDFIFGTVTGRVLAQPYTESWDPGLRPSSATGSV